MRLDAARTERATATLNEAIEAVRRAGVLVFLEADAGAQLTALAAVTGNPDLVELAAKIIRYPEVIGLPVSLRWRKKAQRARLVEVLAGTGTPQDPADTVDRGPCGDSPPDPPALAAPVV